jgi:hypothetical protein
LKLSTSQLRPRQRFGNDRDFGLVMRGIQVQVDSET